MKTLLTIVVICLTFLSINYPTIAQNNYGHFSESQAEHDSLAKILNAAVDNNSPITGELLETAIAVAGDNLVAKILKLGHSEYVSMPSKYPHGLMSNVLTDLNHLKQSSTNSTGNPEQLIELDKKVTEVTERVDDVEELIITKNPQRQSEIMDIMIFRFNNRLKKPEILQQNK